MSVVAHTKSGITAQHVLHAETHLNLVSSVVQDFANWFIPGIIISKLYENTLGSDSDEEAQYFTWTNGFTAFGIAHLALPIIFKLPQAIFKSTIPQTDKKEPLNKSNIEKLRSSWAWKLMTKESKEQLADQMNFAQLYHLGEEGKELAPLKHESVKLTIDNIDNCDAVTGMAINNSDFSMITDPDITNNEKFFKLLHSTNRNTLSEIPLIQVSLIHRIARIARDQEFSALPTHFEEERLSQLFREALLMSVFANTECGISIEDALASNQKFKKEFFDRLEDPQQNEVRNFIAAFLNSGLRECLLNPKSWENYFANERTAEELNLFVNAKLAYKIQLPQFFQLLNQHGVKCEESEHLTAQLPKQILALAPAFEKKLDYLNLAVDLYREELTDIDDIQHPYNLAVLAEISQLCINIDEKEEFITRLKTLVLQRNLTRVELGIILSTCVKLLESDNQESSPAYRYFKNAEEEQYQLSDLQNSVQLANANRLMNNIIHAASAA